VKALSTFNIILFIICIPVFLITTDVRFAANSMRLYEYGFNKYEVSAETGLTKEELTQTARELINYFNSNEESVNIDIFTQREIDHLKDVKGLIQLVYRLQLVSLAYIVIYIIFNFILLRGALWRKLARCLLWGSGATIVLLAVLGLIALVGFDELFLWFHLASFRNDLWLLYPGDKLLQMFPEGFFNDATLFIAAAAIIEALIIGGIAWGFLRLRKKSEAEPATLKSI
jgi:integral membrane protein (TIGR01906 family)